jgi:hypothetical protein
MCFGHGSKHFCVKILRLRFLHQSARIRAIKKINENSHFEKRGGKNQYKTHVESHESLPFMID